MADMETRGVERLREALERAANHLEQAAVALERAGWRASSMAAQDDAKEARAALQENVPGEPDRHSTDSAWGAPSADILTRKLW